MNHWLLRSASLLALIAGTASAQIATPPPPAPAPTPPYVPPPPAPKAPPAKSRSVVPPKPELPNVPYDPIAKFDTEGKLLPLTGSVTRLAIVHNPTIDEATKAKVDVALAHRDARLDQITIDNLDLVEKIDEGAVEKVDGDDMKLILKDLNALCDPLKPPGGDPSMELAKQGILTDTQARFSQKLISEYNKALFDKLKDGLDRNDPESSKKYAKMFTKQQKKIGISETLFRYPALLAEASKNLNKTLPQLGFPADVKAKLESAIKALPTNADDEARFKAMKEAMRSMTIDQQRDLLRKTVALRPALPPMPEQPLKAGETTETK